MPSGVSQFVRRLIFPAVETKDILMAIKSQKKKLIDMPEILIDYISTISSQIQAAGGQLVKKRKVVRAAGGQLVKVKVKWMKMARAAGG